MRVVRCGPAELVIRLPLAERSAGQVLELTPPTVVADLDEELAVGTEENLTAVVIAAHRLASVNRMRVVLLKRVERDQIPIERQRIICRVEDEPVDAVTQWCWRSGREGRVRVTYLGQVAGDGAGAAFRPVKINQMIACKVR